MLQVLPETSLVLDSHFSGSAKHCPVDGSAHEAGVRWQFPKFEQIERHAVEDVVEGLGHRVHFARVGARVPVRHGQCLAGLIVTDGMHFGVELDPIAHDWRESFEHAAEAAFDGVQLVG